MRLRLSFALVVFASACASQPQQHIQPPAPPATPVAALTIASPIALAPPPPAVTATTAATSSTAASADAELAEEEDPEVESGTAELAEAEGAEAAGEPAEAAATSSIAAGGPRYTGELDDAELARLWKESPEVLGSISVGLVEAGRLINGERIPEGPGWVVVDPARAWATRETVEYLTRAAAMVHRIHPDAAPLRVNHSSAKEGGFLPPHYTHQTGRDVDLGLYYRGGVTRGRTFGPKHQLDLAPNWALLRAVFIATDVQVVLLDRRVQKVLYDYALSIGEDRAWLDSLFFAGPRSLVQHARGHRDHFHVRFFNPRAQELGRRIQPFLGDGKPELTAVVHRVRNGDHLGKIARRYGTSTRAIMRANHMRSSFLRAGRTLLIPIRGACVQCPTPPEVIVPDRRLPPSTPEVFAPWSAAGGSAVLRESDDGTRRALR